LLSQVVPMIVASDAYQNNGVIVIWFDESQEDGVAGDNADDFNHTIPEIISSPLSQKNVNGVAYPSPVNLSHSADLRTWQEVFRVGPFLRHAENSPDLSDLFQPGVVPGKP